MAQVSIREASITEEQRLPTIEQGWLVDWTKHRLVHMNEANIRRTALQTVEKADPNPELKPLVHQHMNTIPEIYMVQTWAMPRIGTSPPSVAPNWLQPFQQWLPVIFG